MPSSADYTHTANMDEVMLSQKTQSAEGVPVVAIKFAPAAGLNTDNMVYINTDTRMRVCVCVRVRVGFSLSLSLSLFVYI